MCNFTISVELKGRHINGDEYERLNVLMGTEGFKRKILPPARFHPPNVFTHPDNPPHATYEGQHDEGASVLLRRLESRIKEAIQPEIAIFVAETAD